MECSLDNYIVMTSRDWAIQKYDYLMDISLVLHKCSCSISSFNKYRNKVICSVINFAVCYLQSCLQYLSIPKACKTWYCLTFVLKLVNEIIAKETTWCKYHQGRHSEFRTSHIKSNRIFILRRIDTLLRRIMNKHQNTIILSWSFVLKGWSRNGRYSYYK